MFKLLNRKVYEKLRMDYTISRNKTYNLEHQNLDLKSQIIKHELKEKNLKKIINAIKDGQDISIMMTPKLVETVVQKNFENSTKNIRFYDLDSEFLFGRHILQIWWTADHLNNTIFLNSIEGGKRDGHGELALSLLIEWARQKGFRKMR